MDAKQCDRCKAFYMEETSSSESRASSCGRYIYGVNLFGLNASDHLGAFDLCGNCTNKLISFLKNEEDTYEDD